MQWLMTLELLIHRSGKANSKIKLTPASTTNMPAATPQ